MNDIEIFEHGGTGYCPCMHYGEWRVAIANFGEHFDKEKYEYLIKRFGREEQFVDRFYDHRNFTYAYESMFRKKRAKITEAITQ